MSAARPHYQSGCIRHVLWDWNGTLLDDAWLCIEVLNRLLDARGLAPIALADYRRHFDFPVIEYYRHLGFPVDAGEFEHISSSFISGYRSGVARCELHAGVREALGEVAARGLPQSVLSASEQGYLETDLSAFGLRARFHTVNGIDTIHAPGKLPRGAQWLEESGLAPHEVLMIGDTTHDWEVASALGLHCVLLASGHQDDARLRAVGTNVCASPAELATRLRAGEFL